MSICLGKIRDASRPACGAGLYVFNACAGRPVHVRYRPRPRTVKAFTLTELLVVIAIIGILAALILSAISKVKRPADSAACKNNLRQIAMALHMYVDEHKNYPLGLVPRTTPGERWDIWYVSLEAYLGSDVKGRVFHCPSYKGLGSEGLFRGSTPDISLLPCNPLVAQRLMGIPWANYGYNAMGVDDGTGQYADNVWTGGGSPVGEHGLGGAYLGGNDAVRSFRPCAESQIRVPSDMIALGDALLRPFEGQFEPPDSTNPSPPVRRTYAGLLDLNYLIGRSIGELQGSGNELAKKYADERHEQRDNIAFCDGHVEAIKRMDLYGQSETIRKRWCNDNQPHDIQPH